MTVIIGTRGRYFATSRAELPVVVRTMIAAASCSREAFTAEEAIASVPEIGFGVTARNSLNKGR